MKTQRKAKILWAYLLCFDMVHILRHKCKRKTAKTLMRISLKDIEIPIHVAVFTKIIHKCPIHNKKFCMSDPDHQNVGILKY